MPTLTSPTAVTVASGVQTAIPGITISDPIEPHAGTCALDVSCLYGTVTILNVSGGNSLRLNDVFAVCQAAAASLAFTGTKADTVTVQFWDQEGQVATRQISVAIAGAVAPVTPPIVTPPVETGMPAARAHDVLRMLAVNTHLDFGTSGATPQYADAAAVATAVAYVWGLSGIPPLLRDSPGAATDAALWASVAKASGGATFIAYIAECPPVSYQGFVTRALAMGALVSYLEGPNEPDSAAENGLTGGLTDAMDLAAAAAFMPALFSQRRGQPVINMSFGQGWTAANNWEGNYGSVGDLSASCTYANAHTYPSGVPLAQLQMLNANAKLAAKSRPVAITEFGYQTNVGEDVQAKWTLCAWMDAIAAGNVLFGVYALVDDMSGAWGMFNGDWTPRPLATALRNMGGILADTGGNAATFTAEPLACQVSGCAALLMQKGDGSHWLALWAEAPLTSSENPTVAAVLTLAVKPMTLTRYDPIAGSGPTTLTPTASLTVEVPSYPIVLHIA